MSTDGTHMHTEPGGSCSAGCEESPSSKLVTGRDGQEPSERGMDLWPQKN